MENLLPEKVVFVGNAESGKSSFLRQILTGNFFDEYYPTMGVDVHVVRDRHNETIFNVWDCSGNEQYSSLGSRYWIGATYFVICYTHNSQSECDSTKYWTKKIKKYNQNAKIFYIATKCDIKNPETINIDYETILTSAKDSINLYSVFDAISNS